MEIFYCFKGYLEGEKWQSELFEDADDMDYAFNCATLADGYSQLKQYTVYCHYEEWK